MLNVCIFSLMCSFASRDLDKFASNPWRHGVERLQINLKTENVKSIYSLDILNVILSWLGKFQILSSLKKKKC